MTRGGSIARRYARALKLVGQERGGVRSLLEEVESLTEEVLGSEALRRVLFAPIHPRAERKGVVREITQRIGSSDEVRAFAMLLVDENRTALLPAIRDSLRELVEAEEGRVVARLTSARPLDRAEIDRITEALAGRVGSRVTVTVDVDASILGGVVARVGDLVLDGSVRTQLASLAGSLRRGS